VISPEDPIVIPIGARDIQSDFRGFRALARLHANLAPIQNKTILIDCKGLGWVDAQLGTAILTLVGHSSQNGNKILFQDLAASPKTILQKNGTLSGKVHDRFHTTIPVTPFALSEEVEFAKFAREHLSREEMPRMSADLKDKFFEGVDELFANCGLHSKSRLPVYVGGQFFPVGKKLTFAICDGGQGIAGSLQAAGRTFDSHEKAIDWAMQPNNSARSGDIPGGLGLAILTEFIKLNGGKLTICSNGGYWEMHGENVKIAPIRNFFLELSPRSKLTPLTPSHISSVRR
jgi:hypothetical protein